MAILLIVRPPGGGEPTELTFDQQRVRLGRGAMCDLRLPHQAVSSVHAMIILEKDRYFLVDPGSTNGTTIGGEVLVVERRKLLRSGDVIGIAGFEIAFRAGVAMASHHSLDRTSAAARHLAQQVMADDGMELRLPALSIVTGPQEGQRFEIAGSQRVLSVGRAEDNDLVLDDREASRRHLTLDVTAEGIVVTDLGGKNALLVNERPLTRHRLRDRDELLVGSTRLVFEEPLEAYLRELAQLADAELPRLSFEQVEAPAEERAPEPTKDSSEGALEGDEAQHFLAEGLGGEQSIDGEDPSRQGFTPPKEGSGEGVAVAQEAEKGHILRQRGPSAGVEVAILLVGSLILAVCVAALIWIFR